MGSEGQELDFAGASPAFVEDLYRRWQRDEASVDPTWGNYFRSVEQAVSGPSWQKPNWPPTETDQLPAGLDPTQMQPAPKPAKGGAVKAAPQAEEAPKAVVSSASIEA